ncbi:FlxA-like family protein, partial [Candidatus Parcubacteria bacterium]|nr:FlxA-like family protein [Candidatus Parcubacteria bacterium]
MSIFKRAILISVILCVSLSAFSVNVPEAKAMSLENLKAQIHLIKQQILINQIQLIKIQIHEFYAQLDVLLRKEKSEWILKEQEKDRQGQQVIRTNLLQKTDKTPVVANEFRNNIFSYYGFNPEASLFISNNSILTVLDPLDYSGGGTWYPDNETITLNGEQHKSAVQGLSHVWWHAYRIEHPETAKDFAKDIVKLANLNPAQNPDIVNAIDFAEDYVYGIDGGMESYYCSDIGCADVYNISAQDFDFTKTGDKAKIIDWEIYSGFCSFTMGKFKQGARALPGFMHQYFEPLFTGDILVSPYYESDWSAPEPFTELEKVFVSTTEQGKYTGTLEWYVKDNIWIDDCFCSTVREGDKLLEIIDKKRPVPDNIRPNNIVAQPIQGEPVFEGAGNLWYFDPEYPNPDYVFDPVLEEPITAWVIKVEEEGIFIFDSQTGKEIGRTLPYLRNGSAVMCYGSNDECESTASKSSTWSQCKENAVLWFKKFGFSNTTLSDTASKTSIKNVIQNNNTKYWFSVGHGNSSSFSCANGWIRASDVKNWMSGRDKIWFALLDHCSVMKNTGPGRLSYAFRKGSVNGTVTIGFNKTASPGWIWENELFSLVYDGATWGEAFDRAIAAYPIDGSVYALVGDRDMKITGGYGGDEPKQPKQPEQPKQPKQPEPKQPKESGLTITSPNGGEQWKREQTYDIKWSKVIGARQTYIYLEDHSNN